MNMYYQLIFLLTTCIALWPSATSFTTFPTVWRSERRNVQGYLSASLNGDSNDNDDSGQSLHLFDWARQHGAKISENIEIRSTVYGGRGLFARKDISANTEIIRLPYELQLGVRQLAEGTDEEMQSMARALPWQYILNAGLTFIPLSVALCAEKRKGAASMFEPFLRELPVGCTNAVAPSNDFGPILQEVPKDVHDLETWAPIAARQVLSRRNGIIAIHDQLAPPSLPFHDLGLAAALVCSRSLVRERVQELTEEQTELIGSFCASDHSRLLPVIDLINHGSLQNANVWVGHLGASVENDFSAPDFSTSLKSTRDIAEGEELLFDYGGGEGQKVSNERLLLDFGFVLPDHTQSVALRLEEFVPAISALSDYRMGMIEVSEEEKNELTGIITLLIKLASSLQGAPLLFGSEGQPSVPTLALAIAMTCQGQDDLERLLKPVRQAPDGQDTSLLPMQVVKSSTEEQTDFALFALKNAATMTLAQRQSTGIDPTLDGDEGSFANVAQEYSGMCREMLQRVANM